MFGSGTNTTECPGATYCRQVPAVTKPGTGGPCIVRSGSGNSGSSAATNTAYQSTRGDPAGRGARMTWSSPIATSMPSAGMTMRPTRTGTTDSITGSQLNSRNGPGMWVLWPYTTICGPSDIAAKNAATTAATRASRFRQSQTAMTVARISSGQP